jgi:hypothetical protein
MAERSQQDMPGPDAVPAAILGALFLQLEERLLLAARYPGALDQMAMTPPRPVRMLVDASALVDGVAKVLADPVARSHLERHFAPVTFQIQGDIVVADGIRAHMRTPRSLAFDDLAVYVRGCLPEDAALSPEGHRSTFEDRLAQQWNEDRMRDLSTAVREVLRAAVPSDGFLLRHQTISLPRIPHLLLQQYAGHTLERFLAPLGYEKLVVESRWGFDLYHPLGLEQDACCTIQ